MASKRQTIVGVCVASLSQERYTRFLDALRAEAQHFDYKLMIFGCFQDLYERTPNDLGEKSIFQLLPYENFDALIVLTESFKDLNFPKQIARQAAEHNVPLFSIDRPLDGCINIRYGYADAFADMVEHLITVHGCRKLNLIAGIKGNPFELERTQQYRRVLQKHGIPVEEERIGYGNFWHGPTYQAVDDFMRMNLPFPDAFVCENDAMAIAVCDRLAEYGYSVPEDVLVTGLDGIDEAANRTPSITTAHQDTVGSIQKIFEIYSAIQNGREYETDVTIPFRVSFEQSCGCVPVVANDASKIMARLSKNWARMTTYDEAMDAMRHEVIRLSYREMLQHLASHMLDNSWLCLRSDYNSSIDSEVDFGSYESPNAAFTDQMNCVLWKNGDVTLYNRFYPLSNLLPDIEEVIAEHSGLVFVPLHFQESCFGYMALSLDTFEFNYEILGKFSSNFCTILQAIQQKERVTILNRQLESINRKLTELYCMDPLTGLYNRRGFYEYMDQHFLEDHGADDILILFSIDMDDLKAINDTYGHKEGDFSLCLISDCMKHLVRRYDSLAAARFGGDEFIVAGFFEPHTRAELEIERTFTEQLSFLNTGSGKDYRVAASIGHVSVPVASCDLESAINEADTLMYRQKQAKKKAQREAAGITE